MGWKGAGKAQPKPICYLPTYSLCHGERAGDWGLSRPDPLIGQEEHAKSFPSFSNRENLNERLPPKGRPVVSCLYVNVSASRCKVVNWCLSRQQILNQSPEVNDDGGRGVSGDRR